MAIASEGRVISYGWQAGPFPSVGKKGRFILLAGRAGFHHEEMQAGL
jgi:hypothetical protein